MPYSIDLYDPDPDRPCHDNPRPWTSYETIEAQAACLSCPALVPCGELGVRVSQAGVGVWGALTPDRLAIVRKRRSTLAAEQARVAAELAEITVPPHLMATG